MSNTTVVLIPIEPEKFNYCVGRYWEGTTGALAVYAYGSQVHYDTKKDANAFLKYVKKQSPKHDYKIFRLVEEV
jgi:hypothetical protein